MSGINRFQAYQRTSKETTKFSAIIIAGILIPTVFGDFSRIDVCQNSSGRISFNYWKFGTYSWDIEGNNCTSPSSYLLLRLTEFNVIYDSAKLRILEEHEMNRNCCNTGDCFLITSHNSPAYGSFENDAHVCSTTTKRVKAKIFPVRVTLEKIYDEYESFTLEYDFLSLGTTSRSNVRENVNSGITIGVPSALIALAMIALIALLIRLHRDRKTETQERRGEQYPAPPRQEGHEDEGEAIYDEVGEYNQREIIENELYERSQVPGISYHSAA